MTKPIHIIQRQVFDLILPQERGAYVLQTQIAEQYQKSVLPRLADYLDELVPADCVIRVDRLELDLGSISLSEFEERLLAALKEALDAPISSASEVLEVDSNVLQRRSSDTWAEVLHYFLQTGTLPWWAKIEPAQSLESALFEQMPAWGPTFKQLIKTQLQQTIAFEISALQKLSWAAAWSDLERQLNTPTCLPLRRLVLQFSDSWVTLLSASLYGVSTSLVQEYRTWIRTHLQDVFAGSGPSKELLHWFLLLNLLRQPDLKNNFLNLKDVQGKIKAIQGSSIVERELHFSDDTDLMHPSYTGNNPVKQVSINPDPHWNQAITLRKLPTKNSPFAEEPTYFIENAGLVLLAPYMGSFFVTLGLLDGQQFKDENAQQRAILLLQYLVDDRWDAPEYDLVFNKIICAWPLEETLLARIEPREAEIAEAQQLLEAVIENWSVLKHTSIAGLRETFLQRKGKLTFQESSQSWLLQVEHQAYDVLLSKLPWGYGMIKHSWMPHLLKTEWA